MGNNYLVAERWSHLHSALAAQSRNRSDGLLAMIREWQAHRVVLDGLVDDYGVFLFTGGEVPQRPWELAATTSYLAHPIAADRLATGDVRRYRTLAETVAALGTGAAAVAPRTLRCRQGLCDTFHSAAAELRELGRALAAIVARVGAECDPAPRRPGTPPAVAT
jgi:hypothetical protein